MAITATAVTIDPWFEALAALTNVGVLMFDPDGHVQFAGGIARDLLKCNAEDDLQSRVMPLAETVAKASQSCCDGRMTTLAPTQRREVFTIDSADGPHRIAAAAHAIRTDDCVGVLMLLWDSAAEERMERDLRLASRFRNVGQLYEAMAHDLRSPVASIMISANVLRSILLHPHTLEDTADRPENHEKWIDAIEEGVATLDQSLNLLLGELVAADEQYEECDLRSIVEAVHKIVLAQASKWSIAIEVKLPTRPALLTGHTARLKLALLNIATNAVQAMTEGGTLRLQLDVDAREAMVSIADTGPGIPQEIKAKIFDRYFTTKHSGSGIGLYIAKEIVEAHGGRIDVRSTKGRGTVFEITFPIAAATGPGGR
jgi:signal transduction histidine kinase